MDREELEKLTKDPFCQILVLMLAAAFDENFFTEEIKKIYQEQNQKGDDPCTPTP